MPVPLTPAITVPATPEKVFDEKFYTLLELRPTPTAAPATFQWCPKSSATGEIDVTTPRTFTCDLWAAAAEVPEAAQALGAVLAAFPKIEVWLASKASNPD